MPLHLITAKNIRDPLGPLVESIIARHIAHRLLDDFLIITPDEISARDLTQLFLEDPRLEGVLTGSSILSLPQWISNTLREIEPSISVAPPWVHEALFRPLAQKMCVDLASATQGETRLSIPSLYQLVTAFRMERLGPAELRSFIAAFDPELAASCGRLFKDFGDTLEAHPLTRDFAWQGNSVIQGIKAGKVEVVGRLKTIYWLGFSHSTPLLKDLMGAFEAKAPTLEQIIIVQVPQKTEAQDFIASHWGDRKEVYLTKALLSDPETSLLQFAGPFDEAGYILEEVLKAVKAGADPDSIGLFLPPDLFWESYFSQELEKLGLLSRSVNRRPLSSFPRIAQTFALSPSEAFTVSSQILQDLHKNFSEVSPPPQPSPLEGEGQSRGIILKDLALEIRALHQWKEVLEKVIFYESQISPLERPSLLRIAADTFLEEQIPQDKTVALRTHKALGLMRFQTTFTFQCADRFLPQGPERFFGFPLPNTARSSAGERSLFQHMLGAAASRRVISYSTHSAQGEENPASPYLNEFGQSDFKTERHRPLFVSRRQDSDLKRRLEIEKIRESDDTHDHPHGGRIRETNILNLFQEKMTRHVYSPSQLESYTQCPFKFFASVLLRLKPPEEQLPEGSAAERGEWVHEFLERFFSENRGKIIEAEHSSSLQETLLSQIPQKLQEFSPRFLKQRPWINETLSADFVERTSKTLQGLLKDLWERMALSENPFLPAYFEKTFGMEGSPPLMIGRKGKTPLALRGRIDRIDLSRDGREFIVFDYKTGETSGLSNEILHLKKLQLPIYLKATEKILGEVGAHGRAPLQPCEPRGALAISLKELKIGEGLVKKEEKKRLGLRSRTALWDEESWDLFWEKFEAHLLLLAERILSGDFRAQPDPCDAYCDFRTICRYHERAKPNT